MKHIAFILRQETSHSGDTGFDGTVINSLNYIDYYYQNYSMYKERLPEKLYVQSNFSTILNYDFPFLNPIIPLMSTKMLYLLNNIGKNAMLTIPTCLIDDTYFGEIFDSNGFIHPNVPVNNTFNSIVFTENQDFLDYNNSIFENSIINPEIKIVSKHIMQEPKEGFPPIFREKHDIVNIFVSVKAKQVLEAHGIKGCVFEPVEVTPYDAVLS